MSDKPTSRYVSDQQPAGPRIRFWLMTERGSFLLGEGESLVGRSPDCQVSIEGDDRVSRRHAAFFVDRDTATIRDLGSSNGTFLDGERVQSTVKLFGGEIVRIGGRHLQVGRGIEPPRACVDTDPAVPSRRSASVRPTSEHPHVRDETDISDLTPKVDTSSMSTFLKAAVGWRTPNGEALDPNVLIPMLEMVRDEVDTSGTTEPALARRAAETALGLAVATRKPKWIDYTVSLYATLSAVMPARVIDALEVAVWQVDGADAVGLGEYAKKLGEALDPLDPAAQGARLRIEEQARVVARRSRRKR